MNELSGEMQTGRAKTVLVLGEGDDQVAVLSWVIAHREEETSGQHLRFTGPVRFSQATQEHIKDVVVPVLDHLLELMGLSAMNFALSVKNLSAASLRDRGMQLSGFSADVPVLLALVSAGLQMPLPDDIVSTGHIASPDGEIALVRAIPAKLEATAADKRVRRFLHPRLDSDESLGILAPREKLVIADALARASERIRTIPVENVFELVLEAFPEESVVLASLRAGFFASEPVSCEPAGSIAKAASYLLEQNERRYWGCLNRSLLEGRTDLAKEFLHTRAEFHVSTGSYPSGFGRKCFTLVGSLPPEIRRLETPFPLLSRSSRIRLRSVAAESDYQDLRLLDDAVEGRLVGSRAAAAEEASAAETPHQKAGERTLDIVLSKINMEALARETGLPIDEARASYVMDGILARSGEEFFQVVTSFYLHLVSHRNSFEAPVDINKAGPEAVDLVERTFARIGGRGAALAEAVSGTRGGLRFVLDRMTEQLKMEEQEKYVSFVLKEALDPLDWEDRVRFMEAFLRRAPHLPLELRESPPERLAKHADEIVRAYSSSMDSLQTLLRSI